MDQFKDLLAQTVPATFKDARMTLESVLSGNNALVAEDATTAAYAVAVSLGKPQLASALKHLVPADRVEQAEVAAAIMGMTNVYYSFIHSVSDPQLKALPAQLRMVTYGQQGLRDKQGFEMAALAVSIAGKCKPCITAHVEELRKLEVTSEQLRDLGRVAAAVNAVAKVF